MKIVLRLDFATASAIGAGEARVGHSKSYGSSFGLEVHLGELSSTPRDGEKEITYDQYGQGSFALLSLYLLLQVLNVELLEILEVFRA
jgi:hypothetical protein